MEQIQPAYGLHKETVIAIMMFYKNMKAMVCSPDGDTNFSIVTEVLQGDMLTSHLFILYQASIEKCVKKAFKVNLCVS